MNNEVDQLSGAVKYYGVKINGVLRQDQFITESAAMTQGRRMCTEGDNLVIVQVSSDGQEILFG